MIQKSEPEQTTNLLTTLTGGSPQLLHQLLRVGTFDTLQPLGRVQGALGLVAGAVLLQSFFLAPRENAMKVSIAWAANHRSGWWKELVGDVVLSCQVQIDHLRISPGDLDIWGRQHLRYLTTEDLAVHAQPCVRVIPRQNCMVIVDPSFCWSVRDPDCVLTRQEPERRMRHQPFVIVPRHDHPVIGMSTCLLLLLDHLQALVAPVKLIEAEAVTEGRAESVGAAAV